MVFGSPKILFENIVANAQGLSANEEGIVTFTMLLLNKREKTFKFEAKEKKITEEEKTIRFIDQLRKDHGRKI